MELKAHLVFPGTCEQALNHYKDILGGNIQFVFRKKEDRNTIKVIIGVLKSGYGLIDKSRYYQGLFHETERNDNIIEM